MRMNYKPTMCGIVIEIALVPNEIFTPSYVDFHIAVVNIICWRLARTGRKQEKNC